MEHRAGTDEGDQVWGVDRSPAGLCGVDELVGHGDSSRTRTWPFVTFVLKRTVAKVHSGLIWSPRTGSSVDLRVCGSAPVVCHELLSPDYLKLLNPLWTACEVRGEVVDVDPQMNQVIPVRDRVHAPILAVRARGRRRA